MSSDRKVRVLVAKPGLDGHDRGARVIAYGLRDAGFEVIYTGLRQSPEQIAREAIQEDVDAVGLELLRDQGAEDIPVLVGGLIPEEDKDRLRELGVAGVFTAGTPISEVAQFITSRMAAA
jgi:methylmalonyl-CoA mutase C-terminal domain/subunit